ncbi:iron uptake system protein EfeO [Nocardioides terrisoli]|uniref:iron uptake system protein EfeO n=1 Tax=Nocardioides terrisoli TaxID=3388267 RepID=UPI00287B8B6D|nr:iron uptake system protein EfeO [Nocardioides marmorisolisilvae]
MRPATTHAVGTGLLAFALLPVLAGCGSGDPARTADPSGGSAHHATVTITSAHGCSLDRTTLGAGGITFSVKNVDATAVSEVELLSGQRIVGEKENLPPGFGGTFSVNADAGNYTLYCPGATPERQAVTVTGTAATTDESTATLLRKATRGYSTYVSTQVGYLLQGVRKLDRALHGGNLRAAQVAYAQARPFYEKIEPVAESFTVGRNNLDADIDARANDVPASRFMGFHRIEKGLFADKSLDGLAPFGDGLVRNVKKLQKLTAGLRYQPTELANGAQELLDEVAATKVTGEEERYSHIDLLDVANNVEGAEQAFAQLTPVMKEVDGDLTEQIEHRFAALDKLVESYRDANEPSGYRLYTTLDPSDKRQLAAAVKAVQEPLSRVAATVATA